VTLKQKVFLRELRFFIDPFVFYGTFAVFEAFRRHQFLSKV